MVPLARGGLVPHENGIGRCDLSLGRAMLAARKTRNLRGSFRPRLPWTEKRPERFRNYRPERSTFQCSRTATANRSTHIIPHGSVKRRGRGNLWNQENLAAKNKYRLKDFQTLHKTRRDLPEIGWFSSRGGARRGPSARREKQSQGTQSIRPGQQSPIFRRLPFPPAHTARVDENHPISGRSPP